VTLLRPNGGSSKLLADSYDEFLGEWVKAVNVHGVRQNDGPFVPRDHPGRRSAAPTALDVSIYHGPSAYALG
jgi:hypothetical protein